MTAAVKNRFGQIICTIAVAGFLFMWGIIDHRLRILETRTRSLELQITRIAAKLGVESDDSFLAELDQ